MAIIIKKISKKTWLSMLSFLGVFFALLSRLLFVNGSDLHLGKLEANARGAFREGSSTIISSAYADIGDCYSGGCMGGGGSGGTE